MRSNVLFRFHIKRRNHDALALVGGGGVIAVIAGVIVVVVNAARNTHMRSKRCHKPYCNKAVISLNSRTHQKRVILSICLNPTADVYRV
eukprot:m.71353 g.71353  ORF g.71353 m.71353 type:complete len:89 (+) comp24340_c2_seq1:586-852(+)